jgi:hypothetical protein
MKTDKGPYYKDGIKGGMTHDQALKYQEIMRIEDALALNSVFLVTVVVVIGLVFSVINWVLIF